MSVCKTGAEHIKSLKDGRTVYIDGKVVGRRDRASGVPQLGALVRRALRFPGAARESRADDLHPRRLEPARQPRLADAAQLRRDGAAAQGAAGLGAPALRLHGPFARSSRLRAGRPAHGHRGVPQARRGARQGARRLFRLHQPQRYVPHLRHHQSAGRAWQGLGPAGRGPGRAHRRRGCRRVDDPRRQDARHQLDHGERGVRREPAAAQAGRGRPRLLLRAADERQGAARALAQVLRGVRGVGVRQSDLLALRRERRADVFRGREGAVGPRVRASRPRYVPRPVPRHAGPRLPELPGADPPVGEDQVPGRAGAAAHRIDRHRQDAAGRRAARLSRRAGEHGRGHAQRHGGFRQQARRMVGAEQAFHVFGAGDHPGALPEGDQSHPRACGRRAHHAAVLGARFRRSGAARRSSTRRSARPR